MLLHQRAHAEHGVIVHAKIADRAKAEPRHMLDRPMMGAKLIGFDRFAAREHGPALVGMQRRFREPCVKLGAIAARLVREGERG